MPVTIGIQLTTRCNLSCAHCFVERSGDDIPVDIIKRIIPAAKACQCTCIDFTGGEPTLHPAFSEILALLAENDIGFTMVSNGWNFSEIFPDISPYMGIARRIAFSLDGATEDVHDSNRAEGSFRRVMQAASVCRLKGIPFGFRFAVTRANIHQLEEAALLSAKLGAESLTFIPLQPTPRAVEEKLILDPADLREVKEQTLRLQKIFRMEIYLAAGYHDLDPHVFCPAMTSNELFFNARGELGFCCQLADYEGGARDSEIIGSLENMTLYEAHQRMIDTVAIFRKEKARRLADGELSDLDYHACWYCLKYFNKAGWMAEYSCSPWSENINATGPGKSAKELADAKENITG